MLRVSSTDSKNTIFTRTPSVRASLRYPRVIIQTTEHLNPLLHHLVTNRFHRNIQTDETGSPIQTAVSLNQALPLKLLRESSNSTCPFMRLRRTKLYIVWSRSALLSKDTNISRITRHGPERCYDVRVDERSAHQYTASSAGSEIC